MKGLFKILALGGVTYAALDYFGIVPGITTLLPHSPTGEAPPASSAGGAPGGGAASGGQAAPPLPPLQSAPPAPAAPPWQNAPPAAIEPYRPAPYRPPPPAPVAAVIPAAQLDTSDTESNRMRAVTDRAYAANFPVQLNVDQWNYYRQNATGRQYDIDGMFNPDYREELMTAAVFLQRSADVYGLSGLVAAMTGRR